MLHQQEWFHGKLVQQVPEHLSDVATQGWVDGANKCRSWFGRSFKRLGLQSPKHDSLFAAP